MASIVERNNRFCVVYNYRDKSGKRKQKWETYKTRTEAERRRAEVERRASIDDFLPPKCVKFKDLVQEYIELYGKTRWAVSTYSSNINLIHHYILPYLGNLEITEISTRMIDRYYQSILKTRAVDNCYTKKPNRKLVSPSVIRDIHKLLRNCFNQAEKWELIDRNPCIKATVPKYTPKRRNIWDADTLFRALDLCDDRQLTLAVNLAFCCSLRMGELIGLTWDCIDISEEAIRTGNTSVYIEKEIQRAPKFAVRDVNEKDIIKIFPSKETSTTVLVLKAPKTKSSVRRVYLPKSVAEMLIEWKKDQDTSINEMKGEYHNYNLVFARPNGKPIDGAVIAKSFKNLIRENDLPEVVFHSLRHSSITYKLKLNGGDIKSVQGDSGHAQASMITEQYSHILDADRKRNAQLFETNFYSGKDRTVGASPVSPEAPEAPKLDPEKMEKLLADPAIAAFLAALASKLE